MKKVIKKRLAKPTDVCCPKCGNEMDAVARSKKDAILSNLLFGSYKFDRYVCFGCFWEQRVTSRANSIREINEYNSHKIADHTFHYVSK